MENPSLCSSNKTLGLLEKMVSGMKACVAEMKEEFDESGSLPLTDDSPNLNKFCGKLELLLQIGIRERTGIFGGTKNYWDYLQECLSNNKNLKDGIRFVKSRSELKTNVGRGRAFIRFSLVHHRLADTVQYCLMNGKLFNEWYYGNSLFHNKKLAGDLVMTLYDLNDVQFDLDPRDPELDACWPTFSRKPTGMVYNWRPPSRTGSIASLSSITNLEICPNLSSSLTPNIEEDNAFGDHESFHGDLTTMDEIENMRRVMIETTAKYNKALQRIEELEGNLVAKEFSDKENDLALDAHVMQTDVQKLNSIEGKLDEISEDAATQTDVQESKENALMSTITSLQQQLMEAVNSRENFSALSVASNLEVERLKKFQDESDQLRQENLRLNKDVEELHKDLREIKLKSKEENFFEKAFGDVMHEKASVESLLEQSRKENSNLHLEMKMIKDEKQELQEKLNSTISENHHLLKTNADLQNSLDKQIEVTQALESEVAEMKTRNKNLVINVSTLQYNFEELEKISNEKFQKLLAEKDEIQTFLDEKEKSFESLIQKNFTLEENIQAMMKKDEDGDKEGTQLKGKIEELEEKLGVSQTAMEEKILEAKQLEESVEKLSEEINKVKQINSNLESEKLSLVKELQQTVEKLGEREDECRQFTERLKEMEEKLELQQKSSENLDAEKEKIIQDLREDLEAISGSVQRREKMWENARISMDKDILEKSARIQKLEKLVADGFTKEELVKMERKVSDLDEMLAAVKLEEEIQMERARVQLDDLKQCLGTLEHEKFLLTDQLNQKDKLLKKEREEFLEIQKSWKVESKSFNNDIDKLKKRIIKLVKEKADLWQKTDDLAYEQKLRASYRWMDSADITNCLICQTQFSITVRKHHCRKCGRVLCYSCCNNWVSTPHSGMKERVCNECILNEPFLETTVSSTKDEDSDIESIGEEPVSANSGRESASVLLESRTEANESSYLTCLETSAMQLEDDQHAVSREPERGQNGDILEKEIRVTKESVETTDVIFQDERENESSVSDIGISVGESQTSAGGGLATVQDDNAQKDIDTSVATDDSDKTDDATLSSGVWSLSTSARAAVSWMSTAANVTTSFAAGLIPRSTRAPDENSSSLETPRVSAAVDETVATGSRLETTEEPDRPNCLPLDESVNEAVADDVYDVISPEEISESRLYPVSNPNVTCCPVIRLCDDNTRCLMMLSENELLIKAGKCFAIPVSIEVIGLKLSWEFSTQPKGISFSVTYQESGSSSDEECVALIPLTRLNSHQQIVTGELKAKKLGVYALLFDNQSSRFTAKKLKYQLYAEVSEMTLQNSAEVDNTHDIS